jgi:CheY-like chemotaxis protein
MQGTSLAGRSILIVEDEPVFALGLVTAFQDAGAVVLAARSLADATPLSPATLIETVVVMLR